MAEQDDVLHLIDDTGTAPEASTARKWKVAVIDDDPAVHEGTRFALSDYSLHGQTLEILSAYSAAEGRTLMAAHTDIAAVLLDVIMETDAAGLDLVEYIRNELHERDRPHHPAHRPARPGAGAPRHRPVRHQRLQGEDRADGRQAVHLADRRIAQLSAARAHGADPARTGNHHRRRLDPVRFQIDAAARRGRADPARLAAQCRLRRHPGAARRRQQFGFGFLGARRKRLLQPLHRNDQFEIARSGFAPDGRSGIPAPQERILRSPQRALSAHRQRARSRRAAAGRAPAVGNGPVAGRDLRQPAFDRVRQRDPLSAAAGGQHPARGPCRAAHPRADAGQPPAVVAVAAAAARQRLQERNSGHRRPRSEKPAGRDPRPHRNAGGADHRLALPRRASPPRSSTSATPPSA